MRPKVFIGSSVESLEIADAIQAHLEHDTEPTVWDQGVFTLSSSAVEDLIKKANSVDFAIFVLSADDIVKMRDQQSAAVRDNVIFELGLFIGRLGRERNFLVQPRGRKDLHLPTDLIGVTSAEFNQDRGDKNLEAALGPACRRIRETVKRLGSLEKSRGAERVIYQSSGGSAPYDFKGEGGCDWRDGKPLSPNGKGKLSVSEDGILTVERSNLEGRFEIKLLHKTLLMPPVRRLRVTCQARVDGGEHTLRFLFRDQKAQQWIDHKECRVSSKEWTELNEHLQIPPALDDVLFRLDDLQVSQTPSSVQIRNLVIAEKTL